MFEGMKTSRKAIIVTLIIILLSLSLIVVIKYKNDTKVVIKVDNMEVENRDYQAKKSLILKTTKIQNKDEEDKIIKELIIADLVRRATYNSLYNDQEISKEDIDNRIKDYSEKANMSVEEFIEYEIDNDFTSFTKEDVKMKHRADIAKEKFEEELNAMDEDERAKAESEFTKKANEIKEKVEIND